MNFDDLTKYFERLEATRGRLKMYNLLGELFSQAGEEEVAEIAYLLEARLGPPFAAVNIGMGERMVAAAVGAATKTSEREVSKLYNKLGDLGLVARSLTTKSRRGKLTVSEVYSSLLDIARTSGPGSAEKKVALLAGLIGSASPLSALYIARFAVGRMRLGVGAPTIIEAVARYHPESKADGREARAVIERAYNLCSDLGLTLSAMRERGLAGLKKFKAHVGAPVRMMLAERLPNAEAIVKRLGRCAVESKLDGFRCQVHLRGRKVEIFSRNLERTTGMFPDIAEAVTASVRARSAIIEGEAVAVNEATGEFHPFQVTAQRKRKYKIEEMAREFPLVFVAFDLLYANGKDYINQEYRTRRASLEKLIKQSPMANGRVRLPVRLPVRPPVRLVDRVVTEDASELQEFFEEQIERGLEGIVAKRLDARYEAGARNFNWIKLKRVYRGELSDTIDVVVVGYLRGRGMRARLGVGALLTAVYDKKTDSFKTVGKVGSGLSEKNWIRLRKLLDKSASRDKPARVDSRLVPDIWVEPQYVMTVLADEITRSPVHTCARDKSGAGLALRVPRVVGFTREDKSPE
ncbi:MAG TPA: ATP-dependent DNA ligase, partial [Candidatus Binatia bacterium]|nr:ATP-dependent DNA ligase [Candidatus Binatia bacterium]